MCAPFRGTPARSHHLAVAPGRMGVDVSFAQPRGDRYARTTICQSVAEHYVSAVIEREPAIAQTDDRRSEQRVASLDHGNWISSSGPLNENPFTEECFAGEGDISGIVDANVIDE